MDPKQRRELLVFLIIAEAFTRPELTCGRHPVKHARERLYVGIQQANLLQWLGTATRLPLGILSQKARWSGQRCSSCRSRSTVAGPEMQLVKLSIIGFVAGFLAVLIFHQSLWYLLKLVGLIPVDRPAWPLDPIPPYGVPSVTQKPSGAAHGARFSCHS